MEKRLKNRWKATETNFFFRKKKTSILKIPKECSFGHLYILKIQSKYLQKNYKKTQK